jgi:hypothetical protein
MSLELILLDFANKVLDADKSDKTLGEIVDEPKEKIRKALLDMVNRSFYEGDDSLGKEYQRGYNDMVLSTRLLIEEQRQAINTFCGANGEEIAELESKE